jgi:hypothetical protein
VRTVMQRQRSGRDQRGVLAQAVASKYGRRRPAGLPCTPHRHPCGKQRRLGVFGAVEQFFRAALRQRPQVDAGTGPRLPRRSPSCRDAVPRVRPASRPIASPGRGRPRRVVWRLRSRGIGRGNAHGIKGCA